LEYVFQKLSESLTRRQRYFGPEILSRFETVYWTSELWSFEPKKLDFGKLSGPENLFIGRTAIHPTKKTNFWKSIQTREAGFGFAFEPYIP
jgi:hypothetical protein